MKAFLVQHKLTVIGAIIGAVGGYAYYHFIGCSSGTCVITSQPMNSTLYGTLMGSMFFSAFTPQKTIKKKPMKARILKGWTITRALYTILGTVVIIQSATQAEWMGVFLGSYLAAMGIFAFGCAAGNCFGGNCVVPTARNNNAQATPENVVFEEVK